MLEEALDVSLTYCLPIEREKEKGRNKEKEEGREGGRKVERKEGS